MESIDDKYRDKKPFTVPDGYFGQLTERVMIRLEQDEKKQKPRIIQVLKPYMGLVAMFLLALLIVQTILPRFIDKNQMLARHDKQAIMVQDSASEAGEEIPFDSQFNPTNEEIIEYLALEVNNYDLMYAGIY